MKTRNIEATAIRIMVSCVVVTNKALEYRVLSMIDVFRFGFYDAKIEKKVHPNT